MPIPIPASSREILDKIQADQRVELPNANPTLRESFWLALSVALSKRIFDLNLNFLVVVNALFPDTATGDFAERWGTLVGVNRTPAQPAEGAVVAQGTPGTLIPVGTPLTNSEALNYQTTTAAAIANIQIGIVTLTQLSGIATGTTASAHNLASGQRMTVSGANESGYNVTETVTVSSATTFTYPVALATPTPASGTIVFNTSATTVTVRSTDFGSRTNAPGGAVLRFSSTIPGLNPSSFVDFNELTGGLDVELDGPYQDRYLEVYRNGRAPFSEASIRSVSRTVPGVTRVLVKPITPALGSTTVFFVRDLDPNIIPSPARIEEVRTALAVITPPQIDSTINLIISAPTAVIQNFTFSALVPNTDEMQAAILISLQEFFIDSTTFETDIPRQAYEGAIFRTIDETGATVTSFTLTDPTGTIVVGTGAIAVLGVINFP